MSRLSPHMAYREVPVQVQVRQEGDCFARNMVRMQEMRESLRLCRIALDRMPPGAISARVPLALRTPRGETYFAIDGPRGELGFYLISDGSELSQQEIETIEAFLNAHA